MTVHINGSKGKDLYYNGTKIKEAYYNGNKVYSSVPLYYCYRESSAYYIYFNKYPEVGDIIPFYMKSDGSGGQASSSSNIALADNATIKSVTDTQVTYYGFASMIFTSSRYSLGDLYT